MYTLTIDFTFDGVAHYFTEKAYKASPNFWCSITKIEHSPKTDIGIMIVLLE